VMAHPCPMCLGQEYYLDDRKYFEVVDVYRFWRERNSGQRRSTVGPPG
jgi:hypothetical protein